MEKVLTFIYVINTYFQGVDQYSKNIQLQLFIKLRERERDRESSKLKKQVMLSIKICTTKNFQSWDSK